MRKPIVVELLKDGPAIFQQRCGVCFAEATPLYAAPLWIDPLIDRDRLLCADCLRAGESSIRATLVGRAARAAEAAAELLSRAVDDNPDALHRFVVERDAAAWRECRPTILEWNGTPGEPPATATAGAPDWCAAGDDVLRFAVRGHARNLAGEAEHLLSLAEFSWQLPSFDDWSRLEAENWARGELEAAR